MNQRTYISKLLVMAFGCIISAAIVCAQQISGPLSQNLDQGLNSNVAPAPSTEIEPGANNLLTPDEHMMPYDATGASIVATPLNPSTPQLLVSRPPSQLDGTVRDVTWLTGQHPQTSINIMEVISKRFKEVGLSPSPQPAVSSFNGSARACLGSPLEGTPTEASRTLPSEPESSQTIQSDGQASTSDKSAAAHVMKERTHHGDKNEERGGFRSSSAQPPRDFSKSPLEAFASEGQGSVDPAPSPFERFDQKTFLNPDITSTSSSRNPSTRGARTSLKARTQSELSTRSRSDLSELRRTAEMAKDRGVSRAELRLLKQSSSSEQTKRPTWHNPILQQMETGTNSARP
jgi:hypothetical protein